MRRAWQRAVITATLSAVVLSGCDPIRIEVVHPLVPSENVPGSSTPLAPGDAGLPGGSDTDAGTGDGGTVTCTPAGWTTRQLDEGTDGVEMSFRFDAQGVGHFAYGKASTLHVGRALPGEAPLRLDAFQAWEADGLVVDGAGTRHVLYFWQGVVYYAHDRDGTWRTVSLGEGIPGGLALDASGVLHVVLTQKVNAFTSFFAHGTDPGGDWSPTRLDALGIAGDRVKLTVDAAGHAHFLFIRLDPRADTLWYASNASGTWQAERLTPDIGGASPRRRAALALDAQGRPHVLASDGTDAWLWLKDGATWTKRRVGSFNSHGPALWLEASGRVHALLDHDDKEGGTSHVAVLTETQPGGVWTPTAELPMESPDGGPMFPVNTALHLGADGRIQAGLPYLYYEPVDGGMPRVIRGLRHASYCP